MRKNTSIILPIFTFVIAAAIFTVDTIARAEITAAMLYVAVVLLSVRFCSKLGTIAIAAVCALLTIGSFLLTTKHRLDWSYSLINAGMSVVIIGVTTYLALKIEAVRDAARDLTQTNQLRDALLGSVSHELRTPLTSIVGGVSILADAPALAQDRRLVSLARGVRDEAMRLNADIQNLLDAARITSQGLQARQDWTEPSDIIGAAIERAANRYGPRRITFAGEHNLPLVHLDPVLVEQALGQIIANAAKFSPPESEVTVSAKVSDRQLVVSVTDRGVGLTPEEKAHITERFFRGERHLGKIPGSGLGLWIANTFIGASGGRLEALSPGENRGTTMQVIFPQIRDIEDEELQPQDA